MSPVVQICLSHSWGGLEVVTYEYSRDLNRQGIKCVTVCPPESPLHKKLLSENLPFETLPYKKYFSPYSSKKIREIILRHRSEIVISHQLRDLWLIVPALWFLKVRIYGVMHIVLSVKKKDLLHRYLYSKLRKLICLTEGQKQNVLQNLPVKGGQIEVIPNYVDSYKFNPQKRNDELKKNWNVCAEEKLLVLVGRLDPMKGQLESVEAAKILKDKGFKFKLVLVGEETMNQKGTLQLIKNKCAEYGLQKNLILAGYRTDIPEIMATADIVLVPSHFETFGKVIIEAMASNTPVVACASGGVVDIIKNNETGLLVPPKDPEKLAGAIESLLKNPELENKIRDNAFTEFQAKYTWDVVKNQLLGVLGT